MSEEARKHLKDLREKIGVNDTALRHMHQKTLECTVALKIMKVVRAMHKATTKAEIEKVFAEIDVQAVQIVNYLRENI